MKSFELTNRQSDNWWAIIIAFKAVIAIAMCVVFCSCSSSVASPQIKQTASATSATSTTISAISAAADVTNRSNLATAVAVQAFRIETRNIIAAYEAETQTELIVRLKRGELSSELFAFRKERKRAIMQVATQRRLSLQAVTMQFQLVQ